MQIQKINHIKPKGTDGFVDRAFGCGTRFLTGNKLGLMWMK
ncbi:MULTISPECIES: hypothetical protein [unclassified Microcoleus]